MKRCTVDDGGDQPVDQLVGKRTACRDPTYNHLYRAPPPLPDCSLMLGRCGSESLLDPQRRQCVHVRCPSLLDAGPGVRALEHGRRTLRKQPAPESCVIHIELCSLSSHVVEMELAAGWLARARFPGGISKLAGRMLFVLWSER